MHHNDWTSYISAAQWNIVENCAVNVLIVYIYHPPHWKIFTITVNTQSNFSHSRSD